ncbi:MAG: hypothetical protein HKN91_07510 [Acidimicrobiia bacterium]|nr:hypothetical protein [Acidimicrobiia bacterium]
MARLGADADQLEHLARTFGDRARRTQDMKNELDAHMRQTWWVGAYSDNFRRYWYGTARANMQRVAEALFENERILRRQANEQRQTSTTKGMSAATNASERTRTEVKSNLDGWFGNGLELVSLIVDSAELVNLFVVGQPAFELMRTIEGSFGDGLRAALHVADDSPFAKVLAPISYGLDALSYGLTVNEYGFFDGRTYTEATGSIFSILASTLPLASGMAAGPLGGLVATASFEVGGYTARTIDDKFDTSGAFVDSVIAREGKVPNYEGPLGFPRFVSDGIENVFGGW